MHGNKTLITMGADDRGIFIKAVGHIRAMDCYPLREEVLARLEGPECPKAVFVDLSECTYMDSTFLGLIIAMDGKLKKCGALLSLCAPSAESLSSMTRLGLERILHIEDRDVRFPEMHPISDHGTPGEDFILAVHEALIEKSEEAKKKFALLKEMLENKLKGK